MKRNATRTRSDVLRKKLTLTGWMHNRKALMAVSLLIAVVLWAVVMTDSTTERTRTITVPVSVDLAGSNFAMQNDVHLIEEVTADVSVVVKGPWSAVSALNVEDIRVEADVSNITNGGKQFIPLEAFRNSNAGNYEIASWSPTQVEIACDYWLRDVSVPLEMDVSALKVEDSETMQLGTPVPDVGKDGKLTISGPQTTVTKIAKLVAPMDADEPLSETTNFTPTLKAVDAKGAEVEMKNCTVSGLEKKPLTVTVPVAYYKDLSLSVEWHNAPKAVRENADLLTITPRTVKAIGPKDALAALGDTLVVTTFDFDHMLGKKYEEKVELTLPEAVTLGGNAKEASVTLDLSGYKKKTVGLTVSDANVTFTNNGAKKKTAVEKQKLNVTLFGRESDLEKINATDLKVTVDLANTKESGLKNALGVVSLSNDSEVWFFYGKDATGIPVSVTLS